MSNLDYPIIIIGGKRWRVVPEGTHSANVYDYEDVVRNDGNVPTDAHS